MPGNLLRLGTMNIFLGVYTMPLPSSLLANQSIVIDSSCLIRESSSVLYLGIAKEIYHIDVLAG